MGEAARGATRQTFSGGEPGYLSNVQILRGAAAAMVLVYHIGNGLTDRGYEGRWSALGAGSAGVDVFFVISGFIMAHAAGAAFGRPHAAALFLARRAVRIIPLYWVVTAAAGASLWWVDGLTPERLRWIAASLAFQFYPRADGGDFPVCSQGWTLNFEMLFYLAFALALSAPRRVGLPAVAAGFTLLAAVGQVAAMPWPLARVTDSNTLEFVFGLGLAEAEARRLRLNRPQALVAVSAGSATVLATLGTVDDWLPQRGLVWGVPALAIVAGAVLCRPGPTGIARRALEDFGDVSFSLYLVQPAAIAGVGALADRWSPMQDMPWPVYAALCAVGAVLLAYATHRLVERPMTRHLGRRLGLGPRWRDMIEGHAARHGVSAR